MNETTAKVCEEQVADLTIENAHRVTMIRKKGTDYLWGIERSGFFNGREKWAKGFENQRV